MSELSPPVRGVRRPRGTDPAITACSRRSTYAASALHEDRPTP